MARPADAVGEAAEKLREYWAGLVKHEKEFAKGDDAKFYELVGECVDELWEEEVENTWATDWKDVVVWKRVDETKPGEAERRIRENVGPWLRKARKLKYKRGWVTQTGSATTWTGGSAGRRAQARADRHHRPTRCGTCSRSSWRCTENTRRRRNESLHSI
jgi:hypothetical protein